MAYDKKFVYTQSLIDCPRSKFMANSFWTGSIYHGDLVPLEITRVMPGDSFKYALDVFIRTATPPIAPTMDTIRFSVAAFYVPERLVWAKEKEFLGENTEGYGIQSEVLAPRNNNASSYVTPSETTGSEKRSFATYLGIVRQKTTSLTTPSPIGLNPVRSFLQVYNDWFRNENFMAPYLWDHTQTGDGSRSLASLSGSSISMKSDVPKVCKQLDRYTSCLPWAQKGSPVKISLGTDAPLIAKTVGLATNLNALGGSIQLGYDQGGGTAGFLNNADLGTVLGGKVAGDGSSFSSGSEVKFTNLYADLSQATGQTINEFRLAFATQRYLETLARTGSKYREYIKGIFGVTIGDTTAQMAEYLGGMTITLNIDQVLQTTGYASGGSTTLGAPGASSTSAASDYLFTKSFTEPGYLIVVGYTKHNRTYGQGIDEIYQKHEILEEYNPKFAYIGETAIKSNNLYFSGEAADDDDRFGFQEAWSEYRHKKDVIIGALNPANSSSYNFWSLADNYASKPVLNADFLTEDRNNISRILAGGSSGPDYFVNIKFNRTWVRPMPLFSIPGLIDHH